jgi:hypothetical protein
MAYFETAKRGELQELQDALNSRSLDDKRLALKKVIAQMTLGKDLSTLFQSVIKCLEHQELDIKKLVTLCSCRSICTSSITPECDPTMPSCRSTSSARMQAIGLTP